MIIFDQDNCYVRFFSCWKTICFTFQYNVYQLYTSVRKLIKKILFIKYFKRRKCKIQTGIFGKHISYMLLVPIWIVLTPWKAIGYCILKFNIPLPCDPYTPLPNLQQKETLTCIQVDTCKRMLIVELFTVTENWKQPICVHQWENG